MIRNKGSTKSLLQMVSNLKSYCEANRIDWLDLADRSALQNWIREARYQDLTPSNQKAPLTMDILLQLSKVLPNTRLALMLNAMMLLSHDALLRLKEVRSDIRVQNLIWGPNHAYCDIQIFRSKTHRSGSYILIRIYRRKGPCAVKALEMLLNDLGIWKCPMALIFPSPVNNSTISGSWYRKHLKILVASIGLDPSLYSGHSGRAGGATDLFNSNVPYCFIKLFGRWKSDVALSYYRDKAGMHTAIQSGFSKISSSLSRLSSFLI
jgi:hypothetical protein